MDGLEKVLFDVTVLSSNLDSSIQTAFTQDEAQALLSEPSNIDFSAWGADFIADNIDITEEETAAGEEEDDADGEGSIGTFALRDGSLVDIESDLRKKSFAKTQTFNEVEKSEELESLSLRNLETNNNFIPPYTVTPPPNLPETAAGDPTPTTPTTPPEKETPFTTPEKETPPPSQGGRDTFKSMCNWCYI